MAGIEALDDDGSAPRARIRLKVVPGASRDEIAGAYGDRLRVRVRAAPESGKANGAVLALLAGRLHVPAAALEVVQGHGSPLKSITVRGLSAEQVESLLYGEAP